MTHPDPHETVRIGWAEPAQLPADVIRIESEATRIVLGPSDDGKIDVGLLVQLPPPLGAVRITLTADQIAGLHSKLAGLLALDSAQVAELAWHINNTETP